RERDGPGRTGTKLRRAPICGYSRTLAIGENRARQPRCCSAARLASFAAEGVGRTGRHTKAGGLHPHHVVRHRIELQRSGSDTGLRVVAALLKHPPYSRRGEWDVPAVNAGLRGEVTVWQQVYAVRAR